jgi:hypothetical protein
MEVAGCIPAESGWHDVIPDDPPGVIGLEFVVGASGPKRTLLFRDAQDEYVFTER